MANRRLSVANALRPSSKRLRQLYVQRPKGDPDEPPLFQSSSSYRLFHSTWRMHRGSFVQLRPFDRLIAGTAAQGGEHRGIDLVSNVVDRSVTKNHVECAGIGAAKNV